MTPALYDKALFDSLSGLRFAFHGRHRGRFEGLHASPRSGVSLEFADYRDYCLGDDIRYVDWKVLGRLDRVVVKTFVREEDVPISVLVDLSASMGIGSPSKADYAAQLAVAISYVALKELDRVGLYPFSEALHPPLPPRHGMRQLAKVFESLRATTPGGMTSIDEALGAFAAQSRENGLVFVLSDFLTERGWQEGLLRLLHRGDRIVVVQILSAEDLQPRIEGIAQLVDVETNRSIELTVGPATRAQYRKSLEKRLQELERFAARHQVAHVVASTDLPIRALFHEVFRRSGVLA
ncbi:DUF58 domain-containing protein [Candidatus Bipolaricaulota bacterium]|nr:DUF58 domain-containing protein [Candidatus Bipolaricaulota bacterium]